MGSVDTVRGLEPGKEWVDQMRLVIEGSSCPPLISGIWIDYVTMHLAEILLTHMDG